MASSTAQQPTLTGKMVAQNAARDFARFFIPGLELVINVEPGAVNFPCVRKSGAGSRIIIPREMADESITSPERLLFHLLMLGHEIAHLAHRHLDDVTEQTDEDYHALELWADFYGAKVAMTLLTFGPETRRVATRFWPSGDLADALSSFGDAVGLLAKFVYRDHRRYPLKLERVGLTSNGLASFLRHYYGPSFDPRLHLSIQLRVFSSDFVKDLMSRDSGQASFGAEPVHRAARWHRAKQGSSSAITPGFLFTVLPYLHTTFDQTDEESEESQRIRMAELREAGILPPEEESTGVGKPELGPETEQA